MNGWQTVTALLAILAPLVGVPLTVITFYLRGLREQHTARYADLAQRLDVLEAAVRRASDEVSTVQRDYTTKEEWLRETLWARARLEKLNASTARVDAELDGMLTLLATVERTDRMVSQIGERIEALSPAHQAGVEEST